MSSEVRLRIPFADCELAISVNDHTRLEVSGCDVVRRADGRREVVLRPYGVDQLPVKVRILPAGGVAEVPA
jgi:hypothetical protein